MFMKNEFTMRQWQRVSFYDVVEDTEEEHVFNNMISSFASLLSLPVRALHSLLSLFQGELS